MVTEVNPDALNIAQILDSECSSGHIRGPLHGVPILIKNNIATKDKMNNTAGSYALLGATVPRDSTVASKLRAAGAVILGKANMSQWAAWRGNASNGWSAYGGQCEGVYYANQDPSGSSSGSCVGTAIGLAFAALGEETAGSIILPAQASNVVGIKPTVGLTSRSLVIPVSPRQDTVGPIARTVKDAATILQAIAGRDPEDNYTLAQPSHIPDYVGACKPSALSGAKIGVPRNLIGNLTGTDLTLFNTALETLKNAGATIVDNLNITDYALNASAGPTVLQVLGVDFVSDLPVSYLSKLASNPHNINSVSELRNFTQHFPLENYPTYSTSDWDDGLALGYDNTSPQFWATYQTNLQIGGIQGVLGLITNHSLDALVAPTISAFDLPSRVGSPVITVPLGFDGNFGTLGSTNPPQEPTGNNPIGLGFMGAKWSEEKLIGYAYAFEQKTQVRQKGPQPYIVPKTQLADVIGGSSQKHQQ